MTVAPDVRIARGSFAMKRAVVVTIVVLGGLGAAASPAAAKPKPLKSCIAALDAAESVGTRGDLYTINARRCRQGINAAEKAVATKTGPYTPQPSDFQIDIVVLEQSCFGSAGCSIQYQIKVSYLGAQPLDPTQPWIVSYDVLGGDSPQVGSFTITGDKYQYSREFISTPPDPVVTAVPKQVVKG